MITPVPKVGPNAINPLSKLPAELLLIIRFYLPSPEGRYFSAISCLTRINTRLRQIVIGTADLWTPFGISGAEHFFNHARLCIQRSGTLPLTIQLDIHTSRQNSDLGDRFCDVLHPIVSRIRVLNAYITTYAGLNIVRSVLGSLEMSTLEEMDLDYDGVFHGGPNWAITTPGGGTTLKTFTLTGLYPIDSNLSNLRSLTLGSGASWEWSIALIHTLVVGSHSLETLVFIGGGSTFDVEDDVMESSLPCPPLLSLGMEDGISARFATMVLLALDAPNLESVQVTTPTDTYETSLGGFTGNKS
ncbi:hypothetical protein FRC01_000811 [Tulasnella sp. 417]|nr:hypothetical protein FRC01_000811 [Tulasnella sp. 417]